MWRGGRVPSLRPSSCPVAQSCRNECRHGGAGWACHARLFAGTGQRRTNFHQAHSVEWRLLDFRPRSVPSAQSQTSSSYLSLLRRRHNGRVDPNTLFRLLDPPASYHYSLPHLLSAIAAVRHAPRRPLRRALDVTSSFPPSFSSAAFPFSSDLSLSPSQSTYYRTLIFSCNQYSLLSIPQGLLALTPKHHTYIPTHLLASMPTCCC